MSASEVSFLGPFCAFMSSVTWAMGSAGYSRLAKTHSPFAVNFARCIVAFPLFLISALVSAVWMSGEWSGVWSAFDAVEARHLGWFTLSMLASYAIGDVLFLTGTKALGVPTALTIASSYPLLTASWGALVLGETLSLSQTVGLIVTVAGIAAVILSAPRGNTTLVETVEVASAGGEGASAKATAALPMGKAPIGKAFGVICAVAAAFCWAINSYSVTQGGQDLPAPVGNTLRMGLAIILCSLMGRVILPQSKILLPGSEYRKWLWLFTLEGFAGSYFFLYGLSHSPLAIGSTLAAVAPVISVPVALALKLERFSWKRTAGVITVVFGLWLLVGGLNS